MGKSEEEQHLPRGATSSDRPQNAETECRRCCCCSQIQKLVGFRCILVFLFSLALFLSALFWLPPFLHLADQKNLHDDSKYKGHDIVASFIVHKPVTVLEDYKLQLAREIFDEIEAPSTTTVNILSLDPLPRPNTTKVVFAVDPDGGEYSEASSPAISLIRSLFTSLVIHQSVLQLTSSLFGDPVFFEVLKFKGGITIIPQQNAFPLQKVQTKFNFSLNFPIYQIQVHFNELTNQLKSGLHLTSYENLQVVLSNSEGSTVDAPTIIQSSVLLAVGIPPSKKRLKQLAQTIMGPHNLGLNNTEFGRVKQVRLSTILQHSLNGSDTGSARSPAPAPVPHSSHHHHHHRHHHHHHHHDTHLTPATSPIPAPAPTPNPWEGVTTPGVGSPASTKSAPTPQKSSQAHPPDCPFERRKRSTRNARRHTYLTPSIAPSIEHHHHVPISSPKPQVEPPTHASHSVPALSPLPNVAFAHAEPPPKSGPAAEQPPTQFHGLSISPSSAGCLGAVKWTSLIFVVLMLHV